MKRILLAVCIIVLLASSALARSSDEKNGSAQIVTGRGFFTGLLVATDGANAVTVAVYDSNDGAAGKKLMPAMVITTSATDRVQYIGFDAKEVPFFNGVYVSITCAGTVGYVVYYE